MSSRNLRNSISSITQEEEEESDGAPSSAFSRSRTQTEGAFGPPRRIDSRRRGFTNSGIFKFWSSTEEVGAKQDPKQPNNSPSVPTHRQMVTSASMTNVLSGHSATSSPDVQQHQILHKIDHLTEMVHSSKQERVAWEAKFEAQIEAEIKKIAVLEQQIAQLATALSPQSAEEPDVPVPKKSLSDLILELDPDLF